MKLIAQSPKFCEVGSLIQLSPLYEDESGC